MEKKFIDIIEIDTPELFKKITEYTDALINEATTNGSLEEKGADNEYTREIGRVGSMCADYESRYMKFEQLKFKSPLVVSIEKEMEKRQIKQRQTAELLDVKESTFSQIMTGKRPVSMRMAKRLYKELNIDPGLILEFS
ncbi:MAG TPA: helix-turn-helix transcriptional regulator [Paludibacter sp.]|nr:helix-turn-helix transcriptional regulator [Paludibacter sp.]